ncbi:MAG TPA: hypothetical protein V6C71_06830 [Coleofasciculaceae cyanobacterium]|jgi:hypothetical protein
MLTHLSLLEQAAKFKKSRANLPNSAEVVEALLELEKSAKEKTKYSLADLTGNWNLCFVTGTKKARKRAGIVLGAGKYIPRLIKIKISYQKDRQEIANIGKVINSVKIGFVELSLTGPIKFMPPKGILAFDFTYLKIVVLGLSLYDGYIKNGLKKEAEFEQKEIKHQAFFRYFLIQDNLIAARGRGGGLALWSREE